MKRIILFVFLCYVCGFSVSGFAEEPILVIDPHGHSSHISSIDFTPDGATLISTSFDKSIRLWDVETGELLKTLRHQTGEGHYGEIHAAALSPDGTTLAIGGISHDEHGETPVILFDVTHGEIIGLLPGHPDIIGSLAFSSDGKWLASSSDVFMFFWDMAHKENPPFATIESDSGVFDIAFSPDAKQLISGHVDNSLRFWDLPDLQKAASSTPHTLTTAKKIIKKHSNVVCCVTYSPDGKYIASGDFDGNNFLWTHKGKRKKTFPVRDTIDALAFSPDGKQLVVGGGRHVFVHAVPNGKELYTFEEHAGDVENNAFSNSVTAIAFHGNDLVATAGGNDYEIYLWNPKTGDVKTHILGQGRRFEAVAFADDLQTAFGNTPGGLEEESPLERSFNFSDMQLHQSLPPGQEFSAPQLEYQGKTLRYTFRKWYTLDIEGGGTITNSPRDGWVRSYTFTPQGGVVVGSSHVLRLHSSDGKTIRDFIGHTGEVWGVSVSRNGRILASTSDDQTLKLWDIETGECLATLFVARDREWVCWTPKGYYTASAGGEKYIGWQLNQGMGQAAQFYPVSVFRKRFLFPDVVKRTIALGNFEQALADVQLEATSVTQVLPPTVEWISPEAVSVEADQPTIRIQARIHTESELQSVKVMINGRTQVTRGLAIGKPVTQTPRSEIDQELSLLPGKNKITIFASNADAGAVSEERVVTYHIQDPTLKPNLYMVCIGISKYEQAHLELTYADDDARAVGQLFRAQEGTQYNQVTIKELYDLDATQTNILQAIEWLKEQADQQDVTLLFVAAHGTNEHGKYYLLPADGIPDDLQQTSVSWNHFSTILGELPSRVLLFLDTCHSGQLGQDVSAKATQVDNTEAIRELSSDEYGVVIMAASTGREFSLEHPEWKHGAFTKALLEALEQGEADYSDDGIIHLRELDLYVAERVEHLTGGQQHPTTQKPSSISRFPIVRVK